MKTYNLTAHIEKDSETGFYFGYIPSLPGAHTQGKSLDELYLNLQEVVELCIETLKEDELESIIPQFVGTHQLLVQR